MRLDRLDLNLLVVLDAMIEEKSVTRAGERLKLTQPATSNALSRLRDYFKDPLFVSSGRSMVLTPFTREIADQVRSIIVQARAIAQARSIFDPATSTRRFIVNVSDYVAMFLMVDVMRRVAVEAPGVVIDLDSAAEGVHERFERGTVDFVVVPEQFIAPAHPSERLFDERYCCVAWRGSARFGDTITLDDYLEADHVFTKQRVPSNTSYYRYMRKIVGSSPNYTLLPRFVVGTDRLATVHVRTARRLAEELDLRIIPLPFELPKLVEMLQWHRFQEDDPATSWFRGVMREEAAKLTV